SGARHGALAGVCGCVRQGNTSDARAADEGGGSPTPEGHTIHRLAARHAELFAGRPVKATSPQGRFTDGAAHLSGRVLDGTDAYGKHLLHRYAGGLTLHVHLGLYGRFTDGSWPPPAPVGEVRVRLT